MTFPAPEPSKDCHRCSVTRAEMVSLRAESERRKEYNETLQARMAELERDLQVASGVTSDGRERETVKKLQKADLTQRRDLDQCYDEISRLNQEVQRLERICASNKIITARPAVPDASPNKPAMGWGAFTGNTGAGN